MRYYIINEKTGAWSLMTFTHEEMVRMIEKMYPSLNFIRKDETLHGDKIFLDASKYHKYLDGVRDE